MLPYRPSDLKRFAWIALGLLFLFLGVVGLFLPLLQGLLFLMVGLLLLSRHSRRARALLADIRRRHPKAARALDRLERSALRLRARIAREWRQGRLGGRPLWRGLRRWLRGLQP